MTVTVRSERETERGSTAQAVDENQGLPWRSLPLGAAALLAACGGGDEANEPASRVFTAPTSEASLPAAAAPGDSALAPEPQLRAMSSDAGAVRVTRAEAARFLQQAGFGGNAQDVASVVTLGFGGWIGQQIAMPRSLGHYDWVKPVLEPDGKVPRHYKRVDGSLWQKLITSRDALRQRVTLALSEIFVVSMTDVNYNWCGAAVADYMDRLEAGALGTPGQPVVANGPGTFRYLLEKVSLSHAMGRYLSMWGSKKADPSTGRTPDENYAREILQLFSIGLYRLKTNGQPKLDSAGQRIESYTNADVTELARVFTGWDRANGYWKKSAAFIQKDMRCISANHDSGNKTVLGKPIAGNADGVVEMRAALDLIAADANVGPFISRQLIQRLVASNPSPAYVGRVAQVFNNNGSGVRGDLRAVVKAILLDAEARSTTSKSLSRGKLIEPMVRFAQWGRTVRATSTDWSKLNPSDSGALAQGPLRSPSVFNFFRPGYVHPGTPGAPSAQMGVRGLTVPEFQITNEVTVVGYVNYMRNAIDGVSGVVPNYQAWMGLTAQPAALFDELNLLLAAGRLGSESRNLIVSTVEGMVAPVDDAKKRNRIYATFWLILCSPEYIVFK